MIMKYLPLAEALGWIGFAIFVLTEVTLIAHYVMLLTNKKKAYVSMGFLIMNIVFTLLTVIVFILFIILLVNPQVITSQGKIDPRTMIYFIAFSIVLLVISLIHFVLVMFLQPKFGVYFKNKKIFISFVGYAKASFAIKGNQIIYSDNKVNKRIEKNSKIEKFIISSLDL